MNYSIYFSPTGGTKKVADAITATLFNNFYAKIQNRYICVMTMSALYPFRLMAEEYRALLSNVLQIFRQAEQKPF